MTKEFRIKRAENDRLDVRGIDQVLELFYAAGHKIPGVVVRRSLGPARDIDFLRTAPPGDAVILDSGELPVAIGWQKGPEIVEIQVVTDIAVKVAVRWIARIALQRAPDLLAGFTVTGKRRRPGRSKTGRKNGIARTGRAKHQAVSIENKPPDFSLPKKVFQTSKVGAFRQPNASGKSSESRMVLVARD